MDDRPMWAANRVVAPTPGSAITIPKTANEFAIKALFDRLLKEIQAFSQHENESLTDVWLRMKEMLRNGHGHNLSKGNIIKIFYHGLNEITQEVLNVTVGGNSNYDTDKIMARMDAMTIKMDAQYKELQSRAKQPTLDLDDDDIPMSHKEEAKFMQTFLKQKQLNLGAGTERMIFNIDSAIKHSYSNDDTCFSIDVIDEILEEDFDALLNEGSKILHSIEGTILEEEIFSEFYKLIAMTADEIYNFESDTEEPPFEKITINTDYKIKTSLEEPPTDLELKPLPDNLEYVFLEEPSFLPVIKSSKLSAQNKSKLVSVLKKHKQAFAWKTTNIPGAYLQKTPIRLSQKGEEDYRFIDLQLIMCGGMFKEVLSQGEALKIVSFMEISHGALNLGSTTCFGVASIKEKRYGRKERFILPIQVSTARSRKVNAANLF
ncbi:hypothetical protein Tco_0947021 [Tanacetum coccineum]